MRALTLALVAVASVLAAILVWTLVAELRSEPPGIAPAPAAAPPGDRAAPSEGEDTPARETPPIQ